MLGLGLPLAAHASDLQIVRVFTGWRAADSFRRVSEYFTGRENTGGITIVRSQPAHRAGYYWLVRVKNHGAALSGTKFELQVIPPSKPEPKTFTFAAGVPAGSTLYDFGLTGSDWNQPKARPAAWRLRLLSADGRLLLQKQSFLWALPLR